MQRPNYPSNRWNAIKWTLKSNWEELLRTLSIALAGVAATIGTAQASVSVTTPMLTPTTPGWVWVICACVAVYLITSWLSIIKDARKRRYDPTLALKYTDIFFKDNAKQRERATITLIKFHEGTNKNWKDWNDRSDIDDVLDILDDLGFLLQGHQISDWVVYQYFSYWIELYYEATEEYIELKRRDDYTIWEHLPALYSDMMQITVHKTGKTEVELKWREDLVQALRDEISMPPLSTPDTVTSLH